MQREKGKVSGTELGLKEKVFEIKNNITTNEPSAHLRTSTYLSAPCRFSVSISETSSVNSPVPKFLDQYTIDLE